MNKHVDLPHIRTNLAPIIDENGQFGYEPLHEIGEVHFIRGYSCTRQTRTVLSKEEEARRVLSGDQVRERIASV